MDIVVLKELGRVLLYQIFIQLRAQPEGENGETVRSGLRDGPFKSRYLKRFNSTSTAQTVRKTAGTDMYLNIRQNLEDAVASF